MYLMNWKTQHNKPQKGTLIFIMSYASAMSNVFLEVHKQTLKQNPWQAN